MAETIKTVNIYTEYNKLLADHFLYEKIIDETVEENKRMKNEIERLQEANETIVVLNEQANNEVYWLEQEIERLREALQKISDKHCVECFKDACDALQQKESE